MSITKEEVADAAREWFAVANDPERIAEFVDKQFCIGNYVLTGGELPAMHPATARFSAPRAASKVNPHPFQREFLKLSAVTGTAAFRSGVRRVWRRRHIRHCYGRWLGCRRARLPKGHCAQEQKSSDGFEYSHGFFFDCTQWAGSRSSKKVCALKHFQNF